MTTPAIGVDLGGTKTEIIALGPDGQTLLRRRVPTRAGDYDATIRTIKELVDGAEAELGARGTVGVGHPGSLSPKTGLIRNANSVWLNRRPLGRDIEAALDRRAAFSNDADCLALSEATDGAGADARAVFAIIAGTGTGGGLSVERRLIRGFNGIAGEWGHNPLPWPEADERPGPRCWCGLDGCIEAWLSGVAFARDASAALGEPVDAPEVARRAERGDAAAQTALGRYLTRFTKACATVINLFDPDTIVVGGGISNLDALYRDVPAQWSAWVFADAIDTTLRRAVHGDSSGVRGAAWLGRDLAATRSAPA